ncbi:beta-ketoacyl synthase N-terminal-like domain-containing protein, partial [Streptomyces smyrnaeus]
MPATSIAVVGLACRLPRADSPSAYWRLLRDGRSAIAPMPADRRTATHEPPSGRHGGFLDRVDAFDARFFGVSPREALAMDPQQRLMLELGWEAMEDAGIPASALHGSDTGVFVGAIWDDYAHLLRAHGPAAQTRHTMTGVHRSIIANRLSYTLGLRGPSLTIDAAQASSLAAVHLACESLRHDECRLALAGGVNLVLGDASTTATEHFGGLSPDDRCYTFDARANGFVRGEGGVTVLLKPLADALRDGDRVHCVIEGGAFNNDGATNGLTVPSAEAQEAVIRLAHRRAGRAPAEVQYVELHGTGTRVGDPIEAAALGAALGSGGGRPQDEPLLVGSAKTNIGHLEGASGVAGLLKAALSIAYGELPPSLNYATPNPRIPLADLGLRVQDTLAPWPHPERRKVAGVSSFGMGGTNCHLVLAEAPSPVVTSPVAPRTVSPASDPTPVQSAPPASPEPGPTPGDTIPWPLSGKSQAALRAQAERLRAHVAARPAPDPADYAYSLATTRTAHPHRAVVLGTDTTELLGRLDALAAADHSAPGTVTGEITGGSVAFLFSGQGSQRLAMGRQLHATHPVFADALDEAFACLDPHLERPLHEVVLGDDQDSPLDRTCYAQPALFAVEVALYRLVTSFGLRADHLMGHSVGEIAAAHVAGALSLPDACALVAARGRLMQSVTAPGAMVALQATEDEAVEQLLAGHEDRLALAAVNGPVSIVLSGDEQAVREAAEAWRARGRKVSHLRTSHAFHSPHMDSVLDELRAVAANLTFAEPAVPLVSNVTGALVDPSTLASPDYWSAHARNTVRFLDGMHTLCDAGADTFVELGPDAALAAMARECLTARATAGAGEGTAVAVLRRNRSETHTLLTALAQAYVRGADLSWERVLGGRGRRVELPTYAFQRERYWPERGEGAPARENGPRTSADTADATDVTDAAGSADAADPAGERRERPADEPVPQPPAHDMLETVRTHTALVLGYASADAVDPALTFKQLGLDSLGATELGERLSETTGLPVPATLGYDHPTPRAAARHLDELVAGAPAPTADPRPRGATDEPLAIIGMSCRYPGGADTPEQLWDLVAQGMDAIGGFPEGRGWDMAGLYDPDPDSPGTSYAREGGFLHDADAFDAEFFGISPREALAMDPQQRLVLEAAWEALERSGIVCDTLRHSSTGVFVGLTAQDYGPRLHEPVDGLEGQLLTGTTPSVAAGRVAFTLGLEGPAVTVDTACSSSLTAIHLACQSLRQGESSLALAGGVTVLAGPGVFTEFSRQRGLAPDGRCKAFAAAADGTGWAEGVGLVVLERLSDARRNGHRVLAVVRGSAVNQDGASNGLTAPNGPSQERVIRQALANAGLGPADVDAVEAHGTGTTLGDPIEAQALLATYGQERAAERPLWLGSVKSNIGHTQAAAGVAGVIKMVQSMRHGVLPASLHIDEPSPHVDWESGAVRLLTEPVEWPEGERPRRAAVSSFGISGTNAHLIVEEAPADSPAPVPDLSPTPVPWIVSAREPEALRAQADALATHLSASPHAGVAEVGWSLLTTRTLFEHRAVAVGEDRDVLVAGLSALAEGLPHPDVFHGRPVVRDQGPGPVLVFPGQGSQWVGMGVELLDSSSAFAVRLAECERALDPYVDWSLTQVLRGDGSELARVDVVQPVLWAVMVSLAAVWAEHGVTPAAVVGHSQGEIAAACVVGALSLEDGARVVALR